MSTTIDNASINWEAIDTVIKLAFQEDFKDRGDITTESIIQSDQKGSAKLIARDKGVVAGLPIVKRVFHLLNPEIKIEFEVHDGDSVLPGQELGMINGPLLHILEGERTALNFLQRLSGIASLTHEFVMKLQGTQTKILDTRKTTPGYRYLEKYAVRMGGGENHRMGLYDMVMIKDNHIDSMGGIIPAVTKCVKWLKEKNIQAQIEVETRRIEEIKEAVDLPVDRIMLDNMDNQAMKKAVQLINGKIETEASGDMTLERVRSVAETGVDFISVGCITHSARSLNISLCIDLARK